MSEREYNRIYCHSDRTEGSEKVLLGYKNDLTEILFKKDSDTVFHIPLYTDKINIAESTLIADGATAGPFPAASDRIFKNQKNYGVSTPYGNTSDLADGTWYCSWLHKDEDGKVQWKDRIYNPGFFLQNTARTQLLEYIPHNPVYEDVPSKLTLEQGVQYKYFHIGEKYANEIITTYGGISGEHLKLNLNGWGTDAVNTSNNSLPVKILTDDQTNSIYTRLTDSDRVSANNINFDNNHNTTVSLQYNSSYNFTDEFTLSFWSYSKDWSSTQSTQLVGNYTSKGGYGVFVDTLSTYPFFVIPETGYGHLLLVNEKFEPFLDKSLHPTVLLTATPSFVAVNSDHEIITIEVNKFHKIKKLDHTGTVLKEVSLEASPIFISQTEQNKIGTRWFKNETYNFISKIDTSIDFTTWAAINAEKKVTVSLDKGATWQVVDKFEDCIDIAISSNGIFQTALTREGKVWTSTNKGTTWNLTTNSNANLSGLSLTTVAMSYSGQIQVVAGYNTSIYISIDYGYSWYEKGFINNWKKVLISDEGEFYLAATEDRLFTSKDYGTTWFNKLDLTENSVFAMSKTGSIQVAAVNRGSIYVSNNYGETWTEVKNTINNWQSIEISESGRIQTAVAFEGIYLRVYMSFDYGVTWELKQLIPQTNSSKQITTKISSDEQTQLICTAEGSFYISTENKLLPEYSVVETPLQLLCGRDDSIVVITDKARYTYDKDLNLENALPWTTLPNTMAAYSYDIAKDTSELVSVENVYDCKFINTDCYCISATNDPKTDGNLWVKYANKNTYELYADIGVGSSSSTFGIDPYNRIWLMHDNNKITIFDSNLPPGSAPVVPTFSLGSNISRKKKNISFMCVYDRKTNTRNWRAIIYYGDTGRTVSTPQIFITELSGKLVKIIDTLSLFDLYTVKLLNQEQQNMEFLASGDFTGYEYRRVFNNLSPYKNTPQIVFKTVLTDSTNKPYPYTRIKKYSPIKEWEFKYWQHFVLTLKNRTFTLYNNSLPIATHSYSGSQEVNFLTQPSFFIGTPTGSRFGFNYEIGNTSMIFNGSIQDIKIYDYAIEQKNLEMFLRASILAESMHWSIPTPLVQYIETIERFFKHKVPGAKSSLFNIKLYGTQIKDPITRKVIEEGVRNLVAKIKPAYTDMIGIKWVD